MMRVLVTGGSGFLGQILKYYIDSKRFRIDSFDYYQSWLYDQIKRSELGIPPTSWVRNRVSSSRLLRRYMEPVARKLRLIYPTMNNILDIQPRMANKFRGYDAVIHLAAIPHPYYGNANQDDFYRINYLGSINVYQAAVSVGVKRFIFASSGQVYRINDPIRLDSLPIRESNYCPTLEEGQTPYGYYKWLFEQYLAERDRHEPDVTRVALRLERPGTQSHTPVNLYISTSLENVAMAHELALTVKLDRFMAFNVADKTVPASIVDIPEFVTKFYPKVPYHGQGNPCLMDTTLATETLGYNPIDNGHYLDGKRLFGWD